ncbi:oligosaccharide flippase family protein [[Clostridium] spiroforme]|nr:oligosaccharide flippase family protein [Thomasclavelia spiroformis]
MQNNSRSKNATLNIIIGWGAQFGILFLSFVSRKIFVHFLSAEYLGINGLYGNILSVLALAELGLGNVTQFFLYKPVAEDDQIKICQLIVYFKKLYRYIAMAVFIIGICFVPFLHVIINSQLSQNELIIYYIIFLVNSCVTYFSADKIALLAAYQDNRLNKYITLAVNFFLQICQIIILAIWHNYILYVLATLVSSIANVLITNFLCYRRYPYLKNKQASAVINKMLIINYLKSTFLYKIGATIVNNTDNILISVMVSTASVGLYSNYYMIVSGVQAFLTVITSSLISAIGNLSTSGNKKRMYEVFKIMTLFYHFIGAFGGVLFFIFLNEFISIWLGEKFLLDQKTVFAIAFSFYLTNAISPIWMFRETNGLFIKVKYILLITAVLNILLSIVLGRSYGMFGILIATSFARILTQVWYEPRILFKNLFGVPEFSYWIRQSKYLILSLCSGFFCVLISKTIPQGFVFMCFKACVFFFLFVLIFSIFCYKDKEFKEINKMIFKIIRR